jgi:hypothetical protein
MIVHKVVQGSQDWLRLRSGIPTASCFDRVITPKRGERSGQFETYANELVAERVMGRPLATADMPWMREGIEREPEAAAYYELVRGEPLDVVGFVTTDDGKFGCSPDRLCGDGLVEIKCPRPATHIGYLLDAGPDDAYRVQLQGQLLVTERPWVDIISYYPGLPETIVRVVRDEPFIEKLRVLLDDLSNLIEFRCDQLRARGYQFPSPAIEDRRGWITEEDVDAILSRGAK